MIMNSQLFKMIINNIVYLINDGNKLPAGFKKYVMIYSDGTIKTNDYWEKSTIPYGNYDYIIDVNSGCEIDYTFIQYIHNIFDEIFKYCLNKDDEKYLKLITSNGLMSISWTQKVKLFYAVLLASNSH